MRPFFILLLYLFFAKNVLSQTLDKYDTKELVRAGVKVLIGNQFDKYDTKEIITQLANNPFKKSPK